MYEFLESKEISGMAFIPVLPPVSILKDNMSYGKENGSGITGLPRKLNLYLVDEALAPYQKAKDADGKECHNLCLFPKKGEKTNTTILVDGERKDVLCLDYNFFNYPAPISRKRGDGTVEEYRRKWLSRGVRIGAKLVMPQQLPVWDKSQQAEVLKEVEFAKIDIPLSVWNKDVLDKIKTIKDTLEDQTLQLFDFEITVKFDGTKKFADGMYTVEVKKRKTPIDLDAAKLELSKRGEEFVPPENPFM